ncbi:MAG: radical SAM protein [Myxococcales bacterium]|nr:radical SAM protein [Myxococcales bacterium]
METPRGLDRRQFRAHALDGAALFFQPATGVHVRVATAATRALRRQAPRVAMFGITNACNLTCGFCSRDVARPSAWTVATAAAALRGLHDAGTLEVAYGGGEPFAFRGFAELVAELDATTALAQHVTTNGTLIRAATWAPFAGRLGQVRLSIYDDVPWRPAVEVLAGAGQRWGANLLVDAAALPTLPARLADLAARGCHDASLLSYVGPERARHLDDAGRARLAAIIADSPVACRLSVCFGDRVAAPRLPTGDAGDCGAGRDFVSITPDRQVQSCSFQDRGLPGATAAEILAAWRTQQARLAAPSPRVGCARLHPVTAPPAAPPPIAVWQAFSGNNSGECVLVATFATVADADAYLAELTPGWVPDGGCSPAWQQLFTDEGVAQVATGTSWPSDEGSPRELVAIGASVLAVQYAVDDAFPELRALAWKRGAEVVPGGVHVHGDLTLVVAVRCRDDADRAALLAAAAPGWFVYDEAEPMRSTYAPLVAYPHGDVVVLPMPILGGDGSLPTLVAARDAVARVVGERAHAAEICFTRLTEAELVAAKQRLGRRPPRVPRLWVSLWGGDGADRAAAFARSLGGDRVTVADAHVLIDPAPDRKRLAVLAYRRGATVDVIDSERLELTASPWFEAPPPTKGRREPERGFDRAHLEPTLRATLPREAALTVTWAEHRTRPPRPSITVVTAAPTAALVALRAYADDVGARLNLWAAEVDPVGAMLRRLLTALDR